MGHPWNDGKYKIYIIKHLYQDKGEWAGSGECSQFIPKIKGNPILDRFAFNKLFGPFTASGDCWQKTGIHGSFVKRDAIKIMENIAEWRPEHRFKVCRLLINQVTEDVVEVKYNK